MPSLPHLRSCTPRFSLLNSTSLTPNKPLASSVYVHVLEGFFRHQRSISGTPIFPFRLTMACRFRGLCRPSSQARRRPSGCPESRTARAGSSGRRIAGSSSLGPATGPPGGIPDAVATRGQSAQPKLPVPVRDGPDGDGPEPRRNGQHEDQSGGGGNRVQHRAFLGVGRGEIDPCTHVKPETEATRRDDAAKRHWRCRRCTRSDFRSTSKLARGVYPSWRAPGFGAKYDLVLGVDNACLALFAFNILHDVRLVTSLE